MLRRRPGAERSLASDLAGASNRLVNVEDLSEEELSTRHRHYQALAQMAKADADVHQSHSVDEAQARHRAKALHQRTTAR